MAFLKFKLKDLDSSLAKIACALSIGIDDLYHNEISQDDENFETKRVNLGTDNYNDFILKAKSSFEGYNSSVVCVKTSAKIKVKFSPKKSYRGWYRVFEYSFCTKQKLPLKLKKTIINDLKNNVPLLSQILTDKINISQLPWIDEIFKELNLQTIDDFKIDTKNLASLKEYIGTVDDYPRSFLISIRALIQLLNQHPVVFFPLIGITISSLEKLVEDQNVIFTVKNAQWHILHCIEYDQAEKLRNNFLYDKDDDIKPYKEPLFSEEDLLRLKNLSYLKIGNDYSERILALLPKDNPAQLPKASLFKFFAEFYSDVQETINADLTKRYEYLENYQGKTFFSHFANVPQFIMQKGKLVCSGFFMLFDQNKEKPKMSHSHVESYNTFLVRYRNAIYPYFFNKNVAYVFRDSSVLDYVYYSIFYSNDEVVVPQILSIRNDIKVENINDLENLDIRYHTSLIKNKASLSDFFYNLNPANISAYSGPIQVLFYLYLISLELMKRGAIIPQCYKYEELDSNYRYYGSTSHFVSPKMRWIPAINFPEVKELVTNIGNCLRSFEYHKIINTEGYYTYLYEADDLELGVTYLSYMIETILKNNAPYIFDELFTNILKYKALYPYVASLLPADAIDAALISVGPSFDKKKDIGYSCLPDYFGSLYVLDDYPLGVKPVFSLELIDDNTVLSLKFKPKEDNETSNVDLLSCAQLKEYLSQNSENNAEKEFLSIISKLSSLSLNFSFISKLIFSQEGEINLSTQELPEYLFNYLPNLRSYGFEVIISRDFAEIVRPRTQLKLNLKDTWSVSSGFLNLMDLIDFDWEYSVGDQKVSQRDFNRLLKNAGKIVEFKGKMVYLTKEDAERLKKQKDAHSNASLNKTVLLASALTGTFDNEQVLFEPNVKKAFAELLKKDEIEVPKQINAQLRAYQVRGFNWLMHNLNMGMGSIIADDMGLGKTIQVISAIAKLKDQGELQDKCVLVVLPATLLYNWEHELKRFAPQLDFKIVYGQKPETLESKDHDLFLTTYNYLVHNEELFTNLQLRLLVVDEAQNIKNSKTQASTVLRKLKRDCTIAMTGTPVENHLIEYWSIMDLVNPGLLGTANFFRAHFAYPIERDRDVESATTLKTLVTPFVLRRLKTDKNIIADLPEKQTQNQYCNLSPVQAALYQAKVDDTMKKLESIDTSTAQGRAKRSFAVLTSLGALKQICDAPYVYDEDTKYLAVEDSGKCVLILDLLERLLEQGKKIIIFTQYLKMGDLLARYIEEKFDFKPDFLTGSVSVKERQRMIDDFQTRAECPILLLSLKAGGAGINLTAAQVVIHYDLWWNPAVESQATDRAYRIGQDKNVDVYRLISTGSIEEHIEAMIESKRELNELTVQENERWLGELSQEELSSIMSLKRD